MAGDLRGAARAALVARARGQRRLGTRPHDVAVRHRLHACPSAASSPTPTCCASSTATAITVTTVYPGYIRTTIHEQSVAAGVPLEGSVPVEDVTDAARTLIRAALGEPARDLATTRQGTLSYAVLRHFPDGVARRDHAPPDEAAWHARGHFNEEGLAGEFAARLGNRLSIFGEPVVSGRTPPTRHIPRSTSIPVRARFGAAAATTACSSSRLDRAFVHRVRKNEGKDGNALNEVRMITDSILENGGVLAANSTIKYRPRTRCSGSPSVTRSWSTRTGSRACSTRSLAETESRYP